MKVLVKMVVFGSVTFLGIVCVGTNRAAGGPLWLTLVLCGCTIVNGFNFLNAWHEL